MGTIVTYGWYKLFLGNRERKYVGTDFFCRPIGLDTLIKPLSSGNLAHYGELGS